MQYTLSDIARQFDIPVSTLRYYEKEGGLSFFRRDANGYILIDTADMPSIQLLKIMMRAGLPVKIISRVIGVVESSKKLTDSNEVAALYQQVADTMTDHEDELLHRQQELLDQIKVTRYLRWEFLRYVRAGSSLLDDEPYPGILPAGFSNNDMGISFEELKTELKTKYPDFP